MWSLYGTDWGGTEEVLSDFSRCVQTSRSTCITCQQTSTLNNEERLKTTLVRTSWSVDEYRWYLWLLTIVPLFNDCPRLKLKNTMHCVLQASVAIWPPSGTPCKGHHCDITPRHSTWQPEAVPWKRGFNWNFQCTQWEKWIFLEKLLYQTLSHKTSMKTWWVVRVVISNIFNYGWKSDV